MKKTRNFVLIALVMLSTTVTFGQDALSILKKVDNLSTSSDDYTQNVEITLIDKNNKKQVRKGLILQKGEDKRVFRFTSPSAYKGVSFLSLPNDIMYLYMPAYGKERRIASSIKNQKFAGTDMSYEDLEAKDYAIKYKPVLKSSTGTTYVLELTPKTKSVYSKVILTVNKADYSPKAAEFYNKGGKKVKTSDFNFAKQGKNWYIKSMKVTDLKTKHSTSMKSTSVKFNQNLSDDLFTVRNLKK